MKLRIALVLSFALAGPSIAVACINSMRVSGDDAVKQIANAEGSLARGELSRAERLVDHHEYFFSDRGLRQKAAMVMYTAGIRHKKVSKRRIDASTRFFSSALKKKPEDPLLISRHAEALALSKETAGQARAALEDLVKRDLVPEAQSYTTLARLLSKAGEKTASDNAIASCLKMTKHKQVCSLTPKASKSRRKSRHKSRSRAVLGGGNSPRALHTRSLK